MLVAFGLQEEQQSPRPAANDLEQMNADSVREAETIVAALQQAKDDAEDERHAAEMRIARLKAKAIQAAKQHNALQYELNVAKENTGALQEMIDVYQRKMWMEHRLTRLRGTIPRFTNHSILQRFHRYRIYRRLRRWNHRTRCPAAFTRPRAGRSPTQRTQDPVETGWLDSIKGWLVSLWRSVFS